MWTNALCPQEGTYPFHPFSPNMLRRDWNLQYLYLISPKDLFWMIFGGDQVLLIFKNVVNVVAMIKNTIRILMLSTTLKVKCLEKYEYSCLYIPQFMFLCVNLNSSKLPWVLLKFEFQVGAFKDDSLNLNLLIWNHLQISICKF